jgi:hypothetical protein
VGLIALVDSAALLESAVASVLAGAGIAIAFSLAIYGIARFGDARRGDAPVAAGFAATIAVLGLAAWAAAITVGILIMVGDRT